jgi:hypothetical protein
MSLALLVAHCVRELNQHCFSAMVRGWLRRHPQRVVAWRLESEENYVAQAFERFWHATAFNQQVEFSTLAAALQYLRASLHGAILDMLRAYARPREVSRPVPGEAGEPLVEESSDQSEVWDSLHMILSDPREQRREPWCMMAGSVTRRIRATMPCAMSTICEN